MTAQSARADRALPVGATFYVAGDGDDAAAGTDPRRPLRTIAPLNAIRRFGAGCRILLRGGDRFVGGLDIVLEGTREAPCVLGSYGEGRATLTDGAGHDRHIARISDSQHLRVEALAFVGTLGAHYGTTAFRSVNLARGLSITSTRASGARLRGTVVRGCLFRHTYQGLWIDCEDAPGLDGFDAVSVVDNVFDEVTQFGCYVTGFGRIAGGPTDQLRDVRVAGNRFARILGDPKHASEAQALSVSGATGVIIERNRVVDCCGVGGADAGTPNGGSTAIGVSQVRDFRIAFNVVSGTRCSQPWDASALDADQDAMNGEICGNLTYGNDGPAIQLGSFKGVVTGDLAIHHNVSIDDCRGAQPRSTQGAIRIWGNNHRVQIYANTIVVRPPRQGVASCVNFECAHNRDIVFANNVFKTAGCVPIYRANGQREGEYNATHIDGSCRFLDNCYDASGGRLVISNDDTRGGYRDIGSLDEWRALGHERGGDGSPLGLVGDAGLASLDGFVPPPADAPSPRIEDFAYVDLAPGSPCRGRAIDVRSLLTLRAPIAALPMDARGRLAAQRDLGAVQGD